MQMFSTVNRKSMLLIILFQVIHWWKCHVNDLKTDSQNYPYVAVSKRKIGTIQRKPRLYRIPIQKGMQKVSIHTKFKFFVFSCILNR